MSQLLLNLLKKNLGIRGFSGGRIRMKTKKGKEILPLPEISGNVSIASEKINVFGKDYQKVMNFLSRVSNALGVTIPKVSTLETTKNNSSSLYEVLAHSDLPIPEKFKFILKDEFSNLNSIVFFGKAKSISEARQRAQIHLAECLHSVLKASDLFLSSNDQDVKKVLPYVQFQVSDDQRLKMFSAIEDCSKDLEIKLAADVLKKKFEDVDGVEKSTKMILRQQEEVPKFEGVRPEPLQGKLPIYRHYREIVESIDENQVTIVSATTGSGKTTQIPKFILHHFQSQRPSIIVTQPRRVAAISLANRVAHELGESSVGQSVGFSVRFDSVFPDPLKPNILFCTSGLLLKKLQSMRDETISRCTHLVLDEIHERDINTDILLLAIRRLLGINKKLKVLIMSATLDAMKFHNYFLESGTLKVGDPIKIETDTNFPVALYHLEDVVSVLKQSNSYPSQVSSQTRQFMEKELCGDEVLPEIIPIEIIGRMIKNLHENKSEGAILCFLPGWEEIVGVKNELEKVLIKGLSHHRLNEYQIYCIHSSAPPEIAQSIFYKTEGIRKIILATNIAESSITIPDVAFVIDSGKQKINMYNPALRMNSLKTTWISKSSSVQRLGRVGRTQAGEYYLLCSRDRQLSPSLPPEILRVGLEDVCLSIKGLGFEGKCREIAAELLDNPNKIALRDAVKRLIQLGALEPETENITELGKILSSIPLNPSLGKALVLAHTLGCSDDILTIAAGVGEKVLKLPRFDNDKERFTDFIRNLRQQFVDDHQILKHFVKLFQNRDLSKNFNYEEMNFISMAALKRICKIRSSLESQIKQLLPNQFPDSFLRKNDSITKLLSLSAFYPDISFKLIKRNSYLLLGAISAELQKESMQYVESLEASLANVSQNPSAQNVFSDRSSAKTLIFEELFDVGHTMLVKSSTVDPIFTILFAENVLVLSNTIYIDNWIRITSVNAENLRLLIEMRSLWKNLSSLMVSESTRQNSLIQEKFKICLREFLTIWNSERDVQVK